MGKKVELAVCRTEFWQAAMALQSNLMLNSRPLMIPSLVRSCESVTVNATFTVLECQAAYNQSVGVTVIWFVDQLQVIQFRWLAIAPSLSANSYLRVVWSLASWRQMVISGALNVIVSPRSVAVQRFGCPQLDMSKSPVLNLQGQPRTIIFVARV